MALVGEMQYLTIGDSTYSLPSSGGSGTVTSVGVSNATNGGLTISGSPITSSGSITIGHSNVLTSAQTASGVYPIKIDKNGHISEYGSAVTIPSITLNGSSSTSPSFYAPTSAGTSGYVLKSNGSGAPTWTSAVLTDENVKSTTVTGATTNYIVGSTTSTTTTDGLSKHASAVIYTTADSSTAGSTELRLGNTTSTASAGGKQGQIRLYGSGATYYTTLVPGAVASSNKTITFPNATGTVALTSDIPTVPTITLNGSSTTSPSFYAPTTAGTSGYVLKSNGSGAPTWTSATLTDENLKWTASTTSNTYYPLVSTSTATTSTANTLNGIDFYQYYNTAGGYRRLDLGNTTAYKSTGGAYGTIRLYGAAATYYGDLVPGVLGTTSGDGHISANRTWTLPDKTGTIALTSDVPTVPSITLNGSSTTSPSFYAPTSAGTNGYYLKSNGSGAPSWTAFPTIPTITLNGSSTTSPSFYAPTSAGTNGYVLKSNGSGAPSWTSAVLDATKVQIVRW